MKNLNNLLELDTITQDTLITDQGTDKSTTEAPVDINTPDTAVFQDYMLNDPQFIGFEDHDMLEFCYRLATYDIFSPNVKTVLDFKSRRGDLLSYIINAKKINNIEYVGVDPNTLLCDIAKQKNNHPNARYINDSFFNLKDFKSDLVFSICSLLKTDNVKKLPTQVLLKSLIESMQNNKAENGRCVIILTNQSIDIGDFYQIHPITAIQVLDDLNIRYAIDYLDNDQIYKIIF